MKPKQLLYLETGIQLQELIFQEVVYTKLNLICQKKKEKYALTLAKFIALAKYL